MQISSIDLCLQSHIAGWAVRDGRPAAVFIEVNEETVGTAETVVRQELAVHGLPPEAGFLFRFAEPLTADDIVSARFEDGSHLSGSPAQKHVERLTLLTCNLGEDPGLEIGPLDRPLLSKKKYNVSYVDHDSRDGLGKKYGHVNNPAMVDPLRLVEVDYVWRNRLKTAVLEQQFGWAVACGVVEHIADPIDWIQQIAEVLIPGGVLVLEVPDARMSFDRQRRLTTVAELLDDHRRQLKCPSFRQIYDHISRVAPLGSPEPALDEKRLVVTQAFGVASGAEENEMYVDVHCHVWTKSSWAECWGEISWLGLLPFELEAVSEPFPDTGSFVASLRRL